MHRQRSAIATWAAADVTALVALRPHPARLAHDLGAPHAWLARVGTDGVVAVLSATALWLAAAWLAVGVLATALGRLPGTLGRVSSGLGALVLPRVLYRVVAGSAGLGLLLGPVVSAGAHDAPGPASTSASVPAPIWPVSPSSLPAPQWPDGTSIPPPPPASAPASTPTPAVPSTSAGSRPAPTGRPPSTTPSRPAHPHTPRHRQPTAPRHRAASPGHDSAPTATGSDANTVTVRPNDSLWLLAAHRLGPGATSAQIAREWPRWYAANRNVIGDDPRLIRPGQLLHVPTASTPSALEAS